MAALAIAFATVAFALAVVVIFLLWYIGRLVNQAERDTETGRALETPLANSVANVTPIQPRRLDYLEENGDSRRSLSELPLRDVSRFHSAANIKIRPKSALRNTTGRSTVKHSVSFAGIDEPTMIREKQNIPLAPMVDLKPVDHRLLRGARYNNPAKRLGVVKPLKTKAHRGSQRKRDVSKTREPEAKNMDINTPKNIIPSAVNEACNQPENMSPSKRKSPEKEPPKSSFLSSPLPSEIRRISLPDLGLRSESETGLSKKRRVQLSRGFGGAVYSRISPRVQLTGISGHPEQRRLVLEKTLRAVENQGIAKPVDSDVVVKGAQPPAAVPVPSSGTGSKGSESVAIQFSPPATTTAPNAVPADHPPGPSGVADVRSVPVSIGTGIPSTPGIPPPMVFGLPEVDGSKPSVPTRPSSGRRRSRR